ncbi:MAG: prephenate dehydrogenase/arogenate dehydrogenase family protein [Patescibacteria group bacterium]|jgi:prephenate dehydrogenase
MDTVAIVGFGRFGKTLYQLLKYDFKIVLFDTNKAVFYNYKTELNTIIAKTLKEIYTAPTIFYAVPISSFEPIIKAHKPYFANHLLIDVLSVKLHPKQVFSRYLNNTQTQALLTHPLFGPDSSQAGFAGLPLVIDKFMASQQNYLFWKNYFKSKHLCVIKLSAKQHDQLAAQSQGMAHFIGRLLEQYGYQTTLIDTLGATKLHEVTKQTCNDTWELFLNLQNYNPYTKTMRLRLGQSYDKLYNKLLPKRINQNYLVFGIQGGKGSFNEEAILHYAAKQHIHHLKIKYLYTSEKVLRNLHAGNIDYGVFAIQNAIGGVVQESTYAMAKYKFKIIHEFAIPIKHFLMKKKTSKKVTTIIAHPQVLKQCQSTLKKHYGSYKLVSGKGDLVDTARAALVLAKNKLPGNYAILGPKGLADRYNFEIIGKNLQDDKTNNTTFFVVKR